MDSNSPPACPDTVTVRRNPPRRARPTPSSNPPPASSKLNKTHITPFPTQEILFMEVPQPDCTSSTQIEPPVPENLKVYLRIRPLVPHKSTKSQAVDPNCRRRNKNVWPQNPTAKQNAAKSKADKKKNSELCLVVNDTESVTLLTPLALQESKRIKSVVYDGFSHVFASEISQGGVYEKMVKPLVEDFLNGKSGMIAALGPSGSGKTHTVFGTVREPGMVPLAFQHMFKQTPANFLKQSRSFYISIFEISTEGGKAERLFDLSPDGAELSMQQTFIKGLQEVPITNAEQAECLIASAMMKRATAMTKTNSQSSRSQCIINIHSFVNNSRESDVQPNNAVLTIVDLAGAERERRTGNQGSRLLESNFINNTSMVFGLCLRSLLEHQKNPKKPLQKHFQNSLLTRYLRDYLEGKKRMALILTVKSGEEDYLDTSYLLRQASPYMKIKFNNVEEQSNSVHQKRRIQSSSRVEEPKRKKHCDLDAYVIEEGKSSEEEDSQLEKGCSTVVDAQKFTKLETAAIPSVKSDCIEFRRERDHQIMQNFSKAIWNVLKEYKEKLRAAEKEIKCLYENLRHEKTRYNQLAKEHEIFKSFCTCSKETTVEATFLKVDNDFDVPVYLDGNECNNALEMTSVKEFQCHNSPTMCSLKTQDDRELFSGAGMNGHASYHKAPGCASTPKGNQDPSHEFQDDVNSHSSGYASIARGNQDPTNVMDAAVVSPQIEESKHSCSPGCARDFSSPLNAYENGHSLDQEALNCTSNPGKAQDSTDEVDVNNHSLNHKESQIKCSPRGLEDVANRMDETVQSLDTYESKGGSSPRCAQNFSFPVEKPLNIPPLHKENAAVVEKQNLNEPDCEIRLDASGKSMNLKKPKRRLMPASSTLLRDIAVLGIEDEAEKPKGNRGRNKLVSEERTQGSISLVRLLQRNLRL